MQLSFGKGLLAGAVGVTVLLAITAAAKGTGRGAVFDLGKSDNNVRISSGHHLNASLLGGIGPGGFVQGGGHVVTAEVELAIGQKVTLFNLPGYGKFSAQCIHAPFAEVDFKVGSHKIHLWTQDITGATSGVTEQDMRPGAGLGLQTGASAEQTQWTIQNASSAHLNGHVATVQTDEAVNGTHKCDFAAVAYAAP